VDIYFCISLEVGVASGYKNGFILGVSWFPSYFVIDYPLLDGYFLKALFLAIDIGEIIEIWL
jgi:hypothetical protein